MPTPAASTSATAGTHDTGAAPRLEDVCEPALELVVALAAAAEARITVEVTEPE